MEFNGKRNGSIPKYLFKYHQLNLHLIEMLTSAEFYMAKKSDLNDPLDSTFTISLESYLKLYLEKHPYMKEDKEHIKSVSDIFRWKIDNCNNEWMNDIDEKQSKLRVSCFTEDGNNPLMWSHYANNHTGVCLKFDLERDPNLQKNLHPVRYTDELVEAKNFEDLENCLLTKLNNWNIEKEWRILSEKEKFPFKQEALVEIVLGLKVPNSTMNWFRLFSENVYYMHAPIYMLKIKGNRLVKAINQWGDEEDDISERKLYGKSYEDIGPL